MNWLSGKDPDAGKDWRQEKKWMTEDEMVGWHHQLDEHEFEQALGVGDGQGSLACCSPCRCKELDTTKQLKWTPNQRLVPKYIKNSDKRMRKDQTAWEKPGENTWIGTS